MEELLSARKNQVIVRCPEEGKWLRFRNPIEVFLAANPQEVVSILGQIEKEVEAKKIYAAAYCRALHRPGNQIYG